MKEQLYNLIAGIGPCWNKLMYITENGKGNYLVHLRGGVFFELIKDEEGVYYECHWAGPLVRTNPVDVLAWIKILQESER